MLDNACGLYVTLRGYAEVWRAYTWAQYDSAVTADVSHDVYVLDGKDWSKCETMSSRWQREPKPDLYMGSGSKRGAVGRQTDDTCREYGGMKRQWLAGKLSPW